MNVASVHGLLFLLLVSVGCNTTGRLSETSGGGDDGTSTGPETGSSPGDEQENQPGTTSDLPALPTPSLPMLDAGMADPSEPASPSEPTSPSSPNDSGEEPPNTSPTEPSEPSEEPPPATEPPATEPPATEPPATEPPPSLPAPSGLFTDLVPSADSRLVYVSSTGGNDANDGLSESQPKRTIAAAKALLRHGYPDWMLLKKGDVFEESLGQWKTSGRSATEPMVVTSYGTGTVRPILRTGRAAGLETHGAGGSPRSISHLAVTGIHFHAHTRDTDGGFFEDTAGNAGVNWLLGSEGLLLEDCVFESYGVGLVLIDFDDVGLRNVRLRHLIVVDSYSDDRAQGLYASRVDGLHIEYCVFDHNGWNADGYGSPASIFNHNIYIDFDNSGNVTLRNNIIARGSSHGAQLRSGGVAEDNLFVRNAIGLLLGSSQYPVPGGVEATVRGNAVLEGTDITPSLPRGWGIGLEEIASAWVGNNIIANIITDSDHTPALDEVANTTYVANIIYDWGNDYRNMSGPFMDPERSVASYDATQGGAGTFESFMRTVRSQSRDSYRPEYSADAVLTYIRAGFARP